MSPSIKHASLVAVVAASSFGVAWTAVGPGQDAPRRQDPVKALRAEVARLRAALATNVKNDEERSEAIHELGDQAHGLIKRVEDLVGDVEELQRAAVPVGTVAALAAPPPLEPTASTDIVEIKPGWLLCNGAALGDEPKYDALRIALARQWGRDSQVPDLQGYFLRGADPDKKRDPDVSQRKPLGQGRPEQVGSIQQDAFKRHNHALITQNNRITGQHLSIRGGIGDHGHWRLEDEDDQRHRRYTWERGGSETRPINAAVHWIIRY